MIANDRKHFEKQKVIPVGALQDEDKTLQAVQLYLKHDWNVIEITLRNSAALQILKRIKREFPQVFLGAGTLLDLDTLKKARDAGANFFVSPGYSEDMLRFSRENGVLFIPGTGSPKEMMDVLTQDITLLKFFPASVLGGTQFLKAVYPVFKHKDILFFPTGGIQPDNLKDYLNTPGVLCCGMSYIADSQLIEQGQFGQLEERILRTKAILQDKSSS